MGSIHDCSICFNSFNDHKNRPLILPCGHTFCKACFQREQRGGASQCFLDRKAFPAVSKLTTNFILLQTEAGHTGSQQAAAEAAASDPQAAAGAHASKSWLSRELASLYNLALYLSVVCAALACGWVYVAVSSVTRFLGYALLGLAGVVTGACLLLFAWQGGTWAYDKSRSKWAGLSAEESSNTKISVALLVYFAIVFWATGWLTLLCGLVLPFCVPHVVDFASLHLARFLHVRYRGTYVPRRPLLLASQTDSPLSDRLVFILRSGAVLVGRWSSADANGLITCCAAIAWLIAVVGPRALLVVAAVALVTATMLYVVQSTCKSCALLKRHWDKAADALQDSDLVCVNDVVFLMGVFVTREHVRHNKRRTCCQLMLAGLPVYKAGGWWYVLHYANTVCFVIWACTLASRNAQLLASLLTVAADDLQQYMSKDSDLWASAMFTIFVAHLLYVCWSDPWLLVPVVSLAAVLACSLCADGDTHSDGFPDRLLSIGGPEDDEDDEDDEDADEYEDESYDGEDDEEDDDDGSWEGVDHQLLMRQLRAINRRFEANMGRLSS